MSVRKVALKDILPNPYRQMDRYVMSEDKIENLVQSYANSGFWDGSIQGRESPTREGKIEIAFGHHRVEAARRKRIGEIGIVVAKRSDADMLRMMADENRSEFGRDARVGVETIAAVIGAYERGEIELPPVETDGYGGARQVYKLDLPDGKSKTYTLGTVARFLNWVKPSDGQATSACRQAFDAYRERAATQEALNTLKPSEASEVAVQTVVTAARAARVQAVKAGMTPAKVHAAEKKAAAEAVREVKQIGGFKARDVAVGIAKKAVQDVAGPKAPKVQQVEIYLSKLIDVCEQAEPYAAILRDCRRLIPFVDDLQPASANRLASALEGMLKRGEVGVRSVAAALRSGNYRRVVALLEGEK